MRTRIVGVLIILLISWAAISACEFETEKATPPGSSGSPGSQASSEDSAPTSILPDIPESGNTGGPLKPVCFLNTGTTPATVMAWTYIPLNTGSPAMPSDASTVASPGGNPSDCLSLPLGTYTWCYHWELGDVNDDGMIEYAHTIDGRPVLLDESDSNDLDLAEIVPLSTPTSAGDMPGQCGGPSNPASTVDPRPPLSNGELLFSDNGSGGAEAMFGAEYMAFSYQNGQGQLIANSNGVVLPAMYSNQSYANSIIEVDFTSFNAGGGGQYSIIFRSDDVAGGLASYNIVSLIPGNRTIEFAVWREGWTQTMVSIIADDSISLGVPVHFRLEANGSEYVVFINGSFAAGFIDSQNTSPGIMGMSITTDSAPGSFTYDNLNIYDIP
jgi:hypothetical protein